MAIKLIANYAKRLGLPGYSSHQFSVSCETELTDLAQVPDEAARLYGLLQDSVDREIQQTGFVPGDGYGAPPGGNPASHGNRNGNANHGNNGHHPEPEPVWQCSDRQRELIIGLATELNLDDASLDKRSERLFRRPAHQLNKLGASGLISDLLAEAGTRRQREGRNGANGGDGPSQGQSHRNGNGHGNGYGSGNGNGRTHGRPVPTHRNGGTA